MKKLGKDSVALERRNTVKNQPTTEEITRMLEKVLSHEITQDDASDWANNFIINDDLFEVTDFNAWDYLGAVGCLGKISPDEYLYVDEDIEAWIKKYTENAFI